MNRFLPEVALIAALLLQPAQGRAAALESGPHASAASTSRWWALDCGQGRRAGSMSPPGCVLTVKVRGRLDASRLHLVEQAIARRDRVARALCRDVALRVDVDSPGGEVFEAMEIGRRLRNERASISVDEGAACISACVFLLMGAVARDVSDGARVGIHRPSLGGSDGSRPRERATVDAMAEGIALYADQMDVPRRIVDRMMAIPSDRVELLRSSDLAAYGIQPRARE